MGLTFFCHFLVPCWYLLLCCVRRMGHWDLFMPHTLWCLPSPTTAVPSPGPLQEFPSRGGEVSLCSVTDMQDQFCFVYQGMLHSLRWQGQLYCLVSQGRAAPLLLLCWWLWVLLWARSLWERTVLNLQPLLTEDDEPAFGTSPPLATQQVTLKQRWSLWTLGKL